VGRGGVGGALTGDGAAVKWPGDEVAWQWLKALGGGELWRERGGKEGGVGCGEVTCGRGAFYRCQGGGRRPGDGEVNAAPLMAMHTDYRNRGRRRWPMKEG
jgi:hypothetical protein